MILFKMLICFVFCVSVATDATAANIIYFIGSVDNKNVFHFLFSAENCAYLLLMTHVKTCSAFFVLTQSF